MKRTTVSVPRPAAADSAWAVREAVRIASGVSAKPSIPVVPNSASRRDALAYLAGVGSMLASRR